MDEIENTTVRLARAGFYVGLHFTGEQWQCTLWNNVIQPHRLPTGHGKTALEAVNAADFARVAATK